MIEFEDPDDKYDFDQVKQRSNKMKIRVGSMFFVFLMLILMLVENDFDFNFLETNLVPVHGQCNPLYTFSPEDPQNISVMNAENILKENIMEFAKLEGFSKGYVVEAASPTSEKKQKPEISLEFNGATDHEKEIPQELCGFLVSVVYK